MAISIIRIITSFFGYNLYTSFIHLGQTFVLLIPHPLLPPAVSLVLPLSFYWFFSLGNLTPLRYTQYYVTDGYCVYCGLQVHPLFILSVADFILAILWLIGGVVWLTPDSDGWATPESNTHTGMCYVLAVATTVRKPLPFACLTV